MLGVRVLEERPRLRQLVIPFVYAVRLVDLLNVFRLVLLMFPLHDEAVPKEPGDEEDEEETEQVG